MNREQLNSYSSVVRLIRKDQARLDRLKKYRPDAVFGKAKGSDRHFPFTERSFAVDGAYEFSGNKNVQEEIHNLTYKIQKSIDDHIEEQLAVENFIEEIKNPTHKEIFIELYLNGRKQEDLAREINMVQSSISKIVGKYLVE